MTDCSHLLVFTARTDAADVVERFIGALKLEGDPFAKELRDGVGKMTPEQFTNYASNQAFLALGFALAAAADLQLGSCPMGGFDADGVKNVLALPSNETTVALMAVGLPSDSKKAVPFPKFRFPVDVVCVKR